jgi:hypothetical protein
MFRILFLCYKIGEVFLLLTAGDVCFELMEVGPCQAETPRWYFNSTNNKCQQFMYGGCGGNQNNFQSEEMCNTVCPGKQSVLLLSHLVVC